MFLNVGCGEHYAPGWCNTDLHENGPRPDVVCSVLALPFQDGSVERVYCGHVLEHVAPRDLMVALAEVHRVLADDGELLVVGPDIRLTLRYEPLLLDGVANGAGRWPGDEHRWTPTGEVTAQFLTYAGFDARLVALSRVSDVWPVVDRQALWQFAITARKAG